MPNITKVEYEDIPKIARQMREEGVNLNNELTNAYTSIASLSSGAWIGKRYNDLCVQFNTIKPNIDEMNDLVVKQIPFALETVANNYSQADSGSNITAAEETQPKLMQELRMTNEKVLGFITSEVQTVQKNVENNFKNATDKMNQIEAIFGHIVWESEAATAFKAKFKKLKGDIIESFDATNKLFTKLMEQAKQDMEQTENANTVK